MSCEREPERLVVVSGGEDGTADIPAVGRTVVFAGCDVCGRIPERISIAEIGVPY